MKVARAVLAFVGQSWTSYLLAIPKNSQNFPIACLEFLCRQQLPVRDCPGLECPNRPSRGTRLY
ncbi:unnamed protein product, partial [Nesidiocoris tenuis]